MRAHATHRAANLLLTSICMARRKIFFDKLAKYIGHGIKALIDRPDGRYCFRLHRDRVFYISEQQACRILFASFVGPCDSCDGAVCSRSPQVKHAAALPRDQLQALGCTFGKFTKTKKFRLHVTCLDYLAQHAQYKVWLKPSAEQSFLYGNHVLKAGLGRITEDTPQYQGVVILNMADVPLGFGTASKSTAEVRKLEPQGIVAFHQADGALLTGRPSQPASVLPWPPQPASVLPLALTIPLTFLPRSRRVPAR